MQGAFGLVLSVVSHFRQGRSSLLRRFHWGGTAVGMTLATLLVSPSALANELIDIQIVSNPGSDQTYSSDEGDNTIIFRTEWTGRVSVRGTDLVFIMGDEERQAFCPQTGDCDTCPVFQFECTYEVRPGDLDEDGISIPAGVPFTGSITINNSNINQAQCSSAHANPGACGYSGLTDQSGHKVDGGPVDSAAEEPSDPDQGTADGGQPIDILVAFSAEGASQIERLGAETNVVGTKNLGNFAQRAIDRTNAALEKSGLPDRFALVGTYTSGNETGRGDEHHLSRLLAPGDGVFDDVHTERERLGADVVALIYSARQSPFECGMVRDLPNPTGSNEATAAFAVVHWLRALDPDNDCFAHEAGHLLGATHANAECGDILFSGRHYSDRRSIMAHSTPRCPLSLPFYSWANVLRMGVFAPVVAEYRGAASRPLDPDQGSGNGEPVAIDFVELRMHGTVQLGSLVLLDEVVRGKRRASLSVDGAAEAHCMAFHIHETRKVEVTLTDMNADFDLRVYRLGTGTARDSEGRSTGTGDELVQMELDEGRYEACAEPFGNATGNWTMTVYAPVVTD